MDIYCPKCGEPWDHDALHDMWARGKKVPYAQACKAFQTKGCRAFAGARCNTDKDTERALRAKVVYDVLRDDMDGAAAILSD